jgi:hypothetical protein
MNAKRRRLRKARWKMSRADSVGRRRWIVACIATVCVGPASAEAARAPTATESAGIERAVMDECRASQPDCVWQGDVEVSTRDKRFAFAHATGAYYSSSALLKRRTASSQDWAVRVIEGGGIRECREWYRAASPRVVADLGLGGLLLGDSGEPCPSRRLVARRCGTVPVVTEGVSGRARVRSRGVRCTLARRIVRRNASTGRVPRRWQCLGSGEGSLCVRDADVTTAIGRRWALPYVVNVVADLRVKGARLAATAKLRSCGNLPERFESAPVSATAMKCKRARRIAARFVRRKARPKGWIALNPAGCEWTLMRRKDRERVVANGYIGPRGVPTVRTTRDKGCIS